MNIREKMKAELGTATAWLSTNDLVIKTQDKHSSVGRALRLLRDLGIVTSKAMKGDRYGRQQWALIKRTSENLPDAPTPILIVYQKRTKNGAGKVVKSAVATQSSALNQGDLEMQIEQGVETIIAEFVAASKTFSARDVTTELREQVNAGKIQLDPGVAGTVQVRGKAVAKIDHNLTRTATHQLMRGGKYPTYQRVHAGAGFYKYQPIPDPPVTQTGGSPQDPSASGNDYDGNSTL